MDENKEINYVKLRSSLNERYSFLFKSTFGTEITLLNFDVVDIMLNGDNTLSGLLLHFEVDYNRSIANDVIGVSRMLDLINNKLIEFIHEFPLNPKTFKFDKNIKTLSVSDGVIVKINYELEEKHELVIEYITNYDND